METIDVVILTYNQQNTIERAVQSVLGQIVNCNVNVWVGDDYSTDDTQQILEQFSNKITVIKSVANLGASANLATLLSHCKGQYIAILEGDDYWLEPTKLQKQVDFLRENEDFGSCGCDVQSNRMPNWIIKRRTLELNNFNGLDLCYQTSSIMFKNPRLYDYSFITKAHRNISDRILQGFLLTLGKAHRLNFRGIAYGIENKNGLTYSIYQNKPNCYLLDLKILRELELFLSNYHFVGNFNKTEWIFFGKAYIFLLFYKNKKQTKKIINEMISMTNKSFSYWFLLLPICIGLVFMRKFLQKWR